MDEDLQQVPNRSIGTNSTEVRPMYLHEVARYIRTQSTYRTRVLYLYCDGPQYVLRIVVNRGRSTVQYRYRTVMDRSTVYRGEPRYEYHLCRVNASTMCTVLDGTRVRQSTRTMAERVLERKLLGITRYIVKYSVEKSRSLVRGAK